MALADRITTVATAMQTLLQANAVALGLQHVYYGDQERIPATPAVCVEPNLIAREISGIGGKGQTDNNITIYVICYLAKIQDDQATRLAADQLSESIMDVLHTSITMSGTVVHGHVSGIEYGYAKRGAGALTRVARIEWSGFSKTAIA